ncbi:hypothetical protein [Petrocella atlantisensis]|uniref:hypothetical protein n=1 Tax=Petrocella atlantisensis TaxID=2173034 RepID=UPI000F63F43A|nr:hypothetical protein [Petrocella atlantisensis]
MKKIISLSLLSLLIIASSSTSFAANNVSRMATTKGGLHVAQCAQQMDLGVSECLQMTECIN